MREISVSSSAAVQLSCVVFGTYSPILNSNFLAKDVRVSARHRDQKSGCTLDSCEVGQVPGISSNVRFQSLHVAEQGLLGC